MPSMLVGRAAYQSEPATTDRWRGQIAIVALVLLFAALLVPLPGRFRAPWIVSLQDLAHVPLFAGVAWALQQVMRGRTILAGITALAIAVFGELLQTVVGRSASLADVARGACGIAIFMGWTFAGQFLSDWRCRAAQLACLMIGTSLPLATAWPTLADSMEAWREFPVLADFSSRWENRRWLAEGCRLSCGLGASGEGIGILQCDTDGFPTPSVILFPIRRDWLTWRSLHVEFTVDDGPLPITLSVRDGRKVTPPRRRFDQHQVFQEGRHRAGIDLAQVARGSDQVAPIDLSAVESFHFIIDSGGVGRVIRLHRIWLE